MNTTQAARWDAPAHRRWPLMVAAALAAVAMVAAGCGRSTDASDRRPGRPTTTTAGHRTTTTTPPPVVTGAAIDVHTHVASQALTDAYTGGGFPAVGADDLIALLDEANVRRAIVLSAGYFGAGAGVTDDSLMAPENDYVAAEIAKYPDRLIGFCGINPLFDTAIAEIDRCLDLPGMVGVKLQLEASGVDLADDQHAAALAAVFDRVAERDAPVLMHVAGGYGLPISGRAFAVLGEILTSHPTVRVTHAHCAGNLNDDDIELWLRLNGSGYDLETSFVDISACLEFFKDAPRSQRELIVWRLRQWGIEHVLFGSDYFVFDDGPTAADPESALETLTRYPFTQAELDTILGNDGSAWLRP